MPQRRLRGAMVRKHTRRWSGKCTALAACCRSHQEIRSGREYRRGSELWEPGWEQRDVSDDVQEEVELRGISSVIARTCVEFGPAWIRMNPPASEPHLF